MASPQIQAAAASERTEAEVRAIRARRARLEADLIEEGASDRTVKALATHATAARMAEYESRAFMVQQAVLNATVADNPLTGLHGARVSAWLRYLTENGQRLPGFFEAAVCREFWLISRRYSVAA